MLYYFGFGSCIIPIPIVLTGFAYIRRKLSPRLAFAVSLGPILLYISLTYFFSTFFPNITLQGYDFSTIGKVGVWMSDSIYSKLGRLGAPAIAVLILIFAFLPFQKTRMFSSTFAILRRVLNRK
jgi:hypothetical protein